MLRDSITIGAVCFLMTLIVACSDGPSAQPGEIQIEGDVAFVDWTSEALQLIAEQAPEAYADVVASIRTIKAVEAGSGINVRTKVYRVGNITAYAPNHEPRLQRIWYAGTIVHDACHSVRYERGEEHSGKEWSRSRNWGGLSSLNGYLYGSLQIWRLLAARSASEGARDEHQTQQGQENFHLISVLTLAVYQPVHQSR